MPNELLILHYVSPEHRAEVELLYAAFADASGGAAGANIDAFADAIHGLGLLTDRGLRDFLTYREPTLGTIEQTASFGADESRVRAMSLISQGAMGEVYLGRDPNLKRVVALKRIHTNLSQDRVALQRFLTEAQVTAQLDHPAIVPIYAFEKDDTGGVTYAMKFVRGLTLTDYIDEARRQHETQGRCDAAHSLKARLETLIPVLNAIAYAHRRGVIHRDLKPDNIMVGSFGEVLVMDWGIARVIGRDDAIPDNEGVAAASLADSNGAERTLIGTVIGTPAYLSPEQAAGVVIDPSSDQYALGLVLQEVTTLRRAVSGKTAEQLVEQARLGEREPLSASAEPVPRELRAIIDKASAKEKSDRYASVEAMAEDLMRFLRDESVAADPDRGLRRLVRWVGKNRGLAVVLVAGLLVLGFAVVTLIVWQGQAALEAERGAARARERQMTALGAQIDAQARRMSAKLSRHEAGVAALAATVVAVHAQPAPPSGAVPYTYRGGKRHPSERPAYAVHSPIYGQPVSLRQPDFTVAYDADPEQLRPLLDRLARIGPFLRRMLLESASYAATELPIEAAEELVFKKGVPVTWTYFGSVEGVMIAMPGTWDYVDSEGAEGYDPRLEGWYKEAITRREPRWTTTIDESGAGLLLNCGLAVRTEAGDVLGVASLDLWPAPFIDEMMESPTLTRHGVESMILDDQLRVLVRTSDKAMARELAQYTLTPYDNADVRAAIKGRRTGHLATGGRLAAWNAIGNAGLTYLVIGPEATLLEASHRQPPL